MTEALDLGVRNQVQLHVLTDSTTPYERAAEVFGPQKGADADAVAWLTRQLHLYANRLPRDPRGAPGTGCGGGISGALWPHGADLLSGADAVMDLIDINQMLANAGLVITGEGRLDSQTLTGNLISRLAARARTLHRPIAVIAGEIRLQVHERDGLGLSAMRAAGSPESIAHAAHEICRDPTAWDV